MLVFKLEGVSETHIADTTETSMNLTPVYKLFEELAVKTQLLYPTLLKFVRVTSGKEVSADEAQRYQDLIETI